MYRIGCRYQYWGPNGIEWTRWYDYKSDIKDEPVARVEAEKLKDECKKDKLLHEYVMLKDDENYPE